MAEEHPEDAKRSGRSIRQSDAGRSPWDDPLDADRLAASTGPYPHQSTSAGSPSRARVALSTSTVYPETTASAFELASGLGYDAVELMVGVDPVSADIDYVCKLQDYHQVAVASIHAPCLLVTQNIWGTEPWGKLRRSCEAARRLGAGVVVVHPPFRWQREYAAGFTAGIADLSGMTGITIAVENMYPWRAPGTGFGFQAYAPNWDPTPLALDALTLDLSHAATARLRSMDYVTAWGPRLRHVHLTDGSGSLRDEHLLPGQGDQDAWAVVDRLAVDGYSGYIVHEFNTRRAESRADRERVLAEALAETRTHLVTAHAD